MKNKINVLSSNKEISSLLSSRIKQERLAQGLKQIDLAKKANVGIRIIRELEQNSKISLDSLISVIRALQKIDIFNSLFDFAKERIELDAFEYQEKILNKAKKRVYDGK